VFAGPIFTREAVVSPRRPRLFVMRGVYGTALLILISTAWMIIAGTQVVRNISDMARFGAILFQILVPLQMALLMFMSAIQAASNVSVEKDRQTLVLLLMTRMSNTELVLGKLFSALLSVGSLLLTSAPILMLVVLFGGTSFQQVGWSLAVTLTTCLLAGSLGTMIGYWREKTFQSLALVLLVIAIWVGSWEGLSQTGISVGGISAERIAQAMSPIQAILSASRPTIVESWQTDVVPYLVSSLALALIVIGIAIARVRVWNPNREARPRQQEAEFSSVNIYGEVAAGKESESQTAPTLTQVVNRKSRPVWNNPILWREMMTWAYGKKILFIRLAYWLAAFAVMAALYWAVTSGVATRATRATTVTVPLVAQALAPLMLVSLVILTALAVSSITTERDGKAIDLLMVTDISPKEFLFGKLLGVLYLGTDLILLPLLMCGYLWWNQALSTENFLFVVLGMLILNIFVAALGIHCGMSYASTRTAISVSLGTVFFLFLGVVTCMVMLVSFTGNLEAQLAPFLACIVGGAVGLYVALGWQNPSPALALASMILPFAMFYSITSMLLGHFASVIIVVAFTYGFATTAMLVPRLTEFRISTGRSKTGEAE
jgi:ABC-type Na+ efflux pump permease subunit